MWQNHHLIETSTKKKYLVYKPGRLQVANQETKRGWKYTWKENYYSLLVFILKIGATLSNGNYNFYTKMNVSFNSFIHQFHSNNVYLTII